MVEFKDLPLEIRSEIWAECLTNSDLQGVYFFDPEDFGIKEYSGGDDEFHWEIDREIILAFPTIMHVCHESREYAKTHLSFREDTDTGISVPCRPYSPQKDAFFVPQRHFESFSDFVGFSFSDEDYGRLPDGKIALCREIVHLSFGSWVLQDDLQDYRYDTFADFLVRMTALRLMSFVFGNTDTLDLSKPLAMANLKKGKAELVPGQRRTRVRVEETLEDLMDQWSTWSACDIHKPTMPPPYNMETNEWLFHLDAKRIKRVRGLV